MTGSNAGIGYETAKSLARHGCNVLLANRNMEATQEAIKQIVKEVNASEDNLKSIHLDLSSLQSVKKCAAAIKTVFSEYVSIISLFYLYIQGKGETLFSWEIQNDKHN